MDEEFKWDQENTVFSSVQAVAVYANPEGNLVIRQEKDAYSEDDEIIIIPVAQVPALIAAISKTVKNLQEG